jgi:hypothetical protein
MDRYNSIHVLITGPTRSGTTFLLALFHYMRFYTGYCDAEVNFRQAGSLVAGLEYLTDKDRLGCYPLVIKHPLSWVGGRSLFQVLDSLGLEVKHMLVTTRDQEALVDSNLKFIKYMNRKHDDSRSEAIKQEIRKTLPVVQAELFATIEEREIPHTVIEFPRMVYDREYLFDSIKHLRKVTREKFDLAFDRVADPDKVHH